MGGISMSALIWTTIVVIAIYATVKILKMFKKVYDMNYQLSFVSSQKGHWFWGVNGILTPDENGIKKLVRSLEKFPKVQRLIWVFPFIQTLSVYWPSVLKELFAQDIPPKDELGYSLLRPWLGDGLLLSKGKKWHRNRRLLTSAFHFDILKNYLMIFNNCASVLVDKWKGKNKVAAFENISLLTLDNMLQCTMSSKTDCQIKGKSHPYVQAVNTLAESVNERFFNPILLFDFIFTLTSSGKKFRKALNVVHGHSESIIKARKEKLLQTETLEQLKLRKRVDFLDILLLAKDENNKGLSYKEIRDEVDTFLFEGHDTTASAISWALYNFSVNQDQQKICRSEVLEVLHGRDDIQWEDLSKLNYLTMFIKESLRTHPPVPFVSRELSEPFTFPRDFRNDQFNLSPAPLPNGDQTFSVGTRVEANIVLTHKNPFLWENPQKFDPTRFTPDNIKSRSPFAYVPFSAGPRNCIGQNFAMMEIKVTLAKLLNNFKFSLDKDYPEPFQVIRLVLRAKDDIHLKLARV